MELSEKEQEFLEANDWIRNEFQYKIEASNTVHDRGFDEDELFTEFVQDLYFKSINEVK